MNSSRSGLGLAGSLPVVAGVPHTLILALGVLLSGYSLEEEQGEKSTGLEAILELALIVPSHTGKSKNLSELQVSSVKRI